MLAQPVDRIGRPLNPAQQPGFRLGKEPANKGMDLSPNPLTREEVDALLRVCGRGPIGLRHRALIKLCVDTGLRDKEVRGLDVRAIDLDAGTLRVFKATAKLKKYRTLGVPDDAAAVVERWLRARRELSGIPPRSGPLFCTVTRGSRGLELSKSAMRNALPKLGQRAAIEKRVHMHALRHTFAYWWIRAGKPIDVLSKALGHNDLRTTYRYVDHLMPAEVVDMMRGHWTEVQQPAQLDLAAALTRPDVLAALRDALAGAGVELRPAA